MKCKDCKHYNPECLDSSGVLKKWGDCGNPKLDIDGDIIHAGGFDGYGDFWHMTEDFGCIFIFAEVKEPVPTIPQTLKDEPISITPAELSAMRKSGRIKD